jgi:two-component system, NtrC family, C4-dicarboxylate transport response regulator DctD
MIVDDDIDILTLFSEVLTIEGYQVESFNDPRLALKEFKARNDEYLLIISDIRMPHLSGIDLIKRFASINNQIPFIMMTAFDISEKDIEEINFKEFLTKPINLKKLIMIVNRFVRK